MTGFAPCRETDRVQWFADDLKPNVAHVRVAVTMTAGIPSAARCVASSTPRAGPLRALPSHEDEVILAS